MSTRPARRSSTAFLLSCAALAVAGALLGTANRFVQAAALVLAPHALALFLPVAVLAPSIALHLLRRPGAGLLTAFLASLVALPFSPSGAGVFQAVGSVLVGLLLEAPFAVVRYRRFSWWGSVLGALLVGALLCGIHWSLWGMSRMLPIPAAVMVVLVVAGAIGWALAGLAIGRRLWALGLARQATHVREEDAAR
ncbi:MAG: ECF transporter S component [Microbacterium sp.]